MLALCFGIIIANGIIGSLVIIATVEDELILFYFVWAGPCWASSFTIKIDA